VTRDLCSTSIEYQLLDQDDELFAAEAIGDKAFYVLAGDMVYGRIRPDDQRKISDHSDHNDMEDTLENVHEDLVGACAWISEVVLWIHPEWDSWTHRGTMLATSTCELLVIGSKPFTEVMNRHPTANEVLREFRDAVWNHFFPPKPGSPSASQAMVSDPLPYAKHSSDLFMSSQKEISDLGIGVDYGPLLISASKFLRVCIADVVLDTLSNDRKWTIKVLSRQKDVNDLRKEVEEGKCALCWDAEGSLVRTVLLVALRIVRPGDGKILVRLAKMKGNAEIPMVALPGRLIDANEDARSAVLKLIAEELDHFGGRLVFDSSEVITEQGESVAYGVGTKYVKTVFRARTKPGTATYLDTEGTWVTGGREAKPRGSELTAERKKTSNSARSSERPDTTPRRICIENRRGERTWYGWLSAEEMDAAIQDPHRFDRTSTDSANRMLAPTRTNLDDVLAESEEEEEELHVSRLDSGVTSMGNCRRFRM